MDLLVLLLTVVGLIVGAAQLILAIGVGLLWAGERAVGALLRLVMTEPAEEPWPTWLSDIAPNAVWEYDVKRECKQADEYDAVSSRYWRRVTTWRAGVRAEIKRRLRRRERHDAKHAARKEA